MIRGGGGAGPGRGRVWGQVTSLSTHYAAGYGGPRVLVDVELGEHRLSPFDISLLREIATRLASVAPDRIDQVHFQMDVLRAQPRRNWMHQPGSSHLIDLCGERFESLLVLSRAGRDRHGRATWACRCDCGTQRIVSGEELRRGRARSCGCKGFFHAGTITVRRGGRRSGEVRRQAKARRRFIARERAADRAALRRVGLCVGCKAPADGGSRCANCSERHRALMAKLCERRRAAGTCRRCDLPTAPGTTMCEQHLEKHAAAALRRRQSAGRLDKFAHRTSRYSPDADALVGKAAALRDWEFGREKTETAQLMNRLRARKRRMQEPPRRSAEQRERENEQARARRAKRTPEEKARVSDRRRARRGRVPYMAPEQNAERNAKALARYHALTPEQKRARNCKPRGGGS